MRQENYLYFALAGNNDADKDMAMFPASTFRGAVSMSSTTVEFFFAPQDGTGTTANGVLMTHADIASNTTDGSSSYGNDVHYTVMEKFAQLKSGNRANTTNFTVIKDLNDNLPTNEGPISSTGLTEVTALAITIH
tara:strand:+ start:485 stop:889 length:405 start_codon:yes stop_codon:yes gene_type:complete